MATNTKAPGFRLPYRTGQFAFTYRGRFFVVPPRPPAAPPPKPTNIPLATHELVLAAAGVVAEKWEKFAAWVIAAFAAVSGLAVSNYDGAVKMTSPATVRWVLVLFFTAVVLHAIQKIAATIVQAGVAGGKAGKDMKLELQSSEVRPFLSSLVAVYPRPLSTLIAGTFSKMLTKGVTHVTSIMIRWALASAVLAVLQLLLGLVAMGVIGFTLHDPTP